MKTDYIEWSILTHPLGTWWFYNTLVLVTPQQAQGKAMNFDFPNVEQ